jgi:acyl-CoA thioesterase
MRSGGIVVAHREGVEMPKDFPAVSKGFNPFGELIGLEFTAFGEGRSRCELQVKSELLNPHGVLHGGAIYAMADTGMGGALYSVLDESELCTTVEVKIAYMSAVKTGKLVCETRVLERRSRISILESEVRNGSKLVAKALGTFYIYDAK